MRRYFITGGAGFIGSHLVDRLLAAGHAVTVYDNLCTGNLRFVDKARASPNFRFVQGDVLDPLPLKSAILGHDMVFHLAANADVRFGLDHPDKDLRQNTVATFNVLEAMRLASIKTLAFSSTGSVYGEPSIIPTPEDAPFPIQTSLYGASKLAGEGLIAAYCAGFGLRGYIFRFVSILGDRYTHGHVFDFYRKLLADPERIEVLGDGRQRKSYLHVQDCVDAMLTAIDADGEPVNIFNLGREDSCTVDESLGWICAELGVNPRRHYTGGPRGWVGDSPLIELKTDRIRALGWRPRWTIQQAVVATLNYLRQNQWLMEGR